VPDSNAQARRVENRFPGADANPYLAIAVARSLEEVLRLLDEDNDLKQVLGAHFVKAYCAVKLEEFEAFNKVISSWEREYLLLNV
jgi:glutamine synthetase